MWPKSYKDYPKDETLKKEQVSSGKGIVGCEMHDLNGWGSSLHQPRPKKRGLMYHLLEKIFGRRG